MQQRRAVRDGLAAVCIDQIFGLRYAGPCSKI